MGRGLRGREVLAARRRFGLGLHNVERRQRPNLDARLIIGDQFVGQFGRALRHLDGALREDQVPVRIADVRQRLRNRRARALL